jgi:hypothetical protein
MSFVALSLATQTLGRLRHVFGSGLSSVLESAKFHRYAAMHHRLQDIAKEVIQLVRFKQIAVDHACHCGLR